MPTTVVRGWRRWVRACSRAGVADWLVLWAPLYLMAANTRWDLFSAMVRGLGTLAVAAGTWAAGRGSATPGAERAFAAGWALLWAGALGTALESHEGLRGAGGVLWAGIGLAIGAALLFWAWRKRRGRRVLASRERTEVGIRSRYGAAQVALSAGIVVILAAVVGRGTVGPADLLVYAGALVFYLVLSVEGRAFRNDGGTR